MIYGLSGARNQQAEELVSVLVELLTGRSNNGIITDGLKLLSWLGKPAARALPAVIEVHTNIGTCVLSL